MLADLRLRITRRASEDDGFTLVETIVAVVIIGIVMAAATSFMAGGVRATNQQRSHQVAAQLASDAIELVRSKEGASILNGRSEGNENSGVPGVAARFSNSRQWNSLGTGTPVLRLSPEAVTVSTTTYQKHWFVGKCWHPLIGSTPTGQNTPCVGVGAATDVLFYRVVVAVTWRSNTCADDTCTFISTTLVNANPDDPEFNSTETGTPPSVDNPGNQINTASAAIAAIQATAKGGSIPLTWSAVNLPTGININSAGQITGTPTVAGTYNVTLTATDARKLAGTAAFTWTINPAPTVTNPGNRVSPAMSPVTLPVAATGGTAPVTWGATGLPAGLAIDATTGVITGIPTTVGTNDVTITCTDKNLAVGTAVFRWQILPAVVVTPVVAQVSVFNSPIGVLKLDATGGSTNKYTWAATNLPPGLTLHPVSGTINGKPTARGVFSVTVTATDPLGVAGVSVFLWTVV
jgi:prepilin-type N-terminal cleavage/methylation domain-containing protein